MGLDKFNGEYVEEMTQPIGWPGIDETQLKKRALTCFALRNSVHAVASHWQDQKRSIFDGGVWSGSGANAGEAAFERRRWFRHTLRQPWLKRFDWEVGMLRQEPERSA